MFVYIVSTSESSKEKLLQVENWLVSEVILFSLKLENYAKDSSNSFQKYFFRLPSFMQNFEQRNIFFDFFYWGRVYKYASI